ncbi:MAG: tetratricopeptide repeat protein [Acidobacteria bacterium]|nr:tetratricopeptide repeat protein [Acidobacteriota bacterium]
MWLKYCVLALSFMALYASALQSQYIEWRNLTAGEMKHEEWILQTGYLKGGEQLVSAGLDGCIRIWDSETGKLLKEIGTKEETSYLAMVIPSDGEWIAVGDNHGIVHIWNPVTAELKKEIRADEKQINAISVSSDGKLLAAGGSEGVVRIFSADNAKLLKEISPDKGRIVSLIFSPDQEMLAIGCLDPQNNKSGGEIEVWRWESGKKIHGIPGAPAVRGLAISPDGRLLAGFAFKFAVRLYIIPYGGDKVQASFRVLKESEEPGYLAVWDLKSGKRVATVEAELGSTAVAFSPNSQLLTLSGNNGMLLYELKDSIFVERGRLESQTPIDSFCFLPDGKSLALARRLPRPAGSIIQKNADPFYIAAVNMSLHGETSTFPLKKRTTSGSRLQLWHLVEPSSSFTSDFLKAQMKVLKGQTDQALDAFNKLAKEYPDETEVFRVLSILNASKGDTDTAIKILEDAVKIKPASPMLYRTLGDLFYQNQMWRKAVDASEKALELEPEFGLVRHRLFHTYLNWANTLVYQDRSKQIESIKLFDKAIQLVPDDAFAYSQAGTVRYFLQGCNEAMEFYYNALELQPDYARVYYNLGGCYRTLGNREKAIEAYQLYVSIDEKGEEARVERARNYIEELRK